MCRKWEAVPAMNRVLHYMLGRTVPKTGGPIHLILACLWRKLPLTFQSWVRVSWPTHCSHQESDPHRCRRPEVWYSWQELNPLQPLYPHLKTRGTKCKDTESLSPGAETVLRCLCLQMCPLSRERHSTEYNAAVFWDGVLLSVCCWLRTCYRPGWPQTCSNFPVS